MKKILALSFLFSGSAAVQAQWGAKAGLELNLRSDGGWNSSPRIVLGVDHDHGRRWSIGADALLWSGRVNDVVVHDANGAFAARYDRTTMDLTAQVRMSYLLSGNERASFHVGPALGITYRNERLTLDRAGSNSSAFPETQQVAYATVPIGLRVGVRDELPGGYMEIAGRFMYEVGGTGRLFDIGAEQVDAIADQRVRKPEWTIGLSAAYGFCFSGCNEPGVLQARTEDRERAALRREQKRTRVPKPPVERSWGIRLNLLEWALENTRYGPAVVPSTALHGLGVDVDLTSRWSLGADAMMDMRALAAGGMSDVRTIDPVVDLEYQGQVRTTSSWLVYKQSGTTYAFNARAAYRLSGRRRSAPYLGAWLGLRVDELVLSDPEAVWYGYDGGFFGGEYVGNNGAIVGNAETRIATTHVSVPAGLRVGLDLRAGPVYFDVYLYGGARLMGAGDYFDQNFELTSEYDSRDGELEVHAFHFGTGLAMGLARLKSRKVMPSN